MEYAGPRYEEADEVFRLEERMFINSDGAFWGIDAYCCGLREWGCEPSAGTFSVSLVTHFLYWNAARIFTFTVLGSIPGSKFPICTLGTSLALTQLGNVSQSNQLYFSPLVHS